MDSQELRPGREVSSSYEVEIWKLCDKTYFTSPLQNKKDKVNIG